MKKGKLIVIDGPDGTGKKTQADLLIKRLQDQGIKTEIADFPRYGNKSAAMVEEYLNGRFGDAKEVGPYRASIPYALDRFAAAYEIGKPNMWEQLNSGLWIVSNRYTSANMIHQGGKISDPIERDKFLEWVYNLEFKIFKIPKPDLNIGLIATPEVSQELVDKKGHRDYVGGKKRDIHEADKGHLRDACDSLIYCANKFNWALIDCIEHDKEKGDIIRSKQDISNEVWSHVSNLL